MLTWFRRLLVIVAVAFWQGGFTFYAAVVVPVGTGILGSQREQALITQPVTNYLNLVGALALLPLAWDIAMAPASWLRRARWSCWLGMVVTLGVLAWLHMRLDGLFDPATLEVLRRRDFRFLHRCYLWTSTLQWGCALIYLALSVASWRREDGAASRVA